MPTKNKLVKQLIQKHSLHRFPEPWNKAAIRAIMEFATLAAQHERKAVRAVARKNAKDREKLVEEIEDMQFDHNADLYGTGIAMLSTRKRK